MISLTYGTVVALVASHTGTSVVIYSVVTSCIVFARKRFTVVGIWKREINGRRFAICTRTVYISNDITFLSSNRWNRRENDLTYPWSSCSPRNQPYRYKYSYLLRRDKLHRFRKEKGDSHRYLKNRNKQ